MLHGDMSNVNQCSWSTHQWRSSLRFSKVGPRPLNCTRFIFLRVIFLTLIWTWTYENEANSLTNFKHVQENTQIKKIICAQKLWMAVREPSPELSSILPSSLWGQQMHGRHKPDEWHRRIKHARYCEVTADKVEEEVEFLELQGKASVWRQSQDKMKKAVWKLPQERRASSYSYFSFWCSTALKQKRKITLALEEGLDKTILTYEPADII